MVTPFSNHRLCDNRRDLMQHIKHITLIALNLRAQLVTDAQYFDGHLFHGARTLTTTLV